jgi:hypothetical protein
MSERGWQEMHVRDARHGHSHFPRFLGNWHALLIEFQSKTKADMVSEGDPILDKIFGKRKGERRRRIGWRELGINHDHGRS